MKALWELADFVQALRRRLRFGDLSRAPLQFLRVELRGDELVCEWIVRPADEWDASLRECERQRSMSQQALRDALMVRDLIFVAFPRVSHAVLRAFRPSSAREPPELVIAGHARRADCVGVRVGSWAMKAKLYGLQFYLDDGILRELEREEAAAVSELLNESIASA